MIKGLAEPSAEESELMAGLDWKPDRSRQGDVRNIDGQERSGGSG